MKFKLRGFDITNAQLRSGGRYIWLGMWNAYWAARRRAKQLYGIWGAVKEVNRES